MLTSCLAEPTFRASKLTKQYFCTGKRPLPAVCLVLAALVLGAANAAAAAASHRGKAARPDLIADFPALAQQRPWTCRQAASAQASPAWPDGKAECAWQERLRKTSWSWSDDEPSSCLSRQARWWNRAQAGLPPSAPRSVWDGRWSAQTLRFSVDGEERLLILRRGGDAQWLATEWRWNPNPRPATRRWQEGRWALLVEAAARHQPQAATGGQPDAARMQPVFRRVLGARPGESGSEGLRFETARLCVRVSNPLPGQPKLALPYSPNDSRLEQRAAMHLQLSRQHPDVKWLTQFRMLDMPANLPSGAKFLATWVEGAVLNSQLWMPAKNGTATVRLRASTRLPSGGDNAAVLWQARQTVERELAAIAVQWATAYE